MNEKAKKYVLSQPRTGIDAFGDQTVWDIADENGDGFHVVWSNVSEDFMPNWRNPECLLFSRSAECINFNSILVTVYGLDAEESLEKIIETLGIDVDLDQSTSAEVQE